MFDAAVVANYAAVMSSKKLAIARILGQSGILSRLSRWQRSLQSPFIRVVNYHDVPASLASEFDRHLAYYAERFVPVGPEELLGLQRGEWSADKPGLILSFDDGVRSATDTVAPLLDRYGFVGWFMIPVDFPDSAPTQQAAFVRDHDIACGGENFGDPRVAASWEDLRALSERHVIGCHTASHIRLSAELTPERLEEEIGQAKTRMEKALDQSVDTFCWVGGEEWSYSASAADVIARAGFRFSFMTNSLIFRPGADLLQIQRTNIEAADPIELVEFQLSGLMDFLYWPKRRRVNALTRTAAPS